MCIRSRQCTVGRCCKVCPAGTYGKDGGQSSGMRLCTVLQSSAFVRCCEWKARYLAHQCARRRKTDNLRSTACTHLAAELKKSSRCTRGALPMPQLPFRVFVLELVDTRLDRGTTGHCKALPRTAHGYERVRPSLLDIGLRVEQPRLEIGPSGAPL